MKKVNVETTKLNNEDIIATSGESVKSSKTWYLNVQCVNGHSTSDECSYLFYKNPGDTMPSQCHFEDGKLPSDFPSKGGELYYCDSRKLNLIKKDIPNAKNDDWYVWNGTSWEKTSFPIG